MPDATAGTAIAAGAPEGAGDRDEAILTVSDLELSFGGVRALAGTDLDVLRGSITALIGPNGAGKTTLFNAITGFYAVDRGEAFFDGQALVGKPPLDCLRLAAGDGKGSDTAQFQAKVAGLDAGDLVQSFAELSKWVAVALTFLSGWLYLWKNRRLYLQDL